MTKALTLDEARETALNEYGPRWLRIAESLIDAKIAIARQEIAALSDGDRTRADDARVGGAAEQAVPLDGCPPGIFEFDGSLGFKTEYGTMSDKTGRYHAEAYVVESGEYFWGGTTTFEDRGKLMVRPLDTEALCSRDATIAGLRAQLDEKDRRIAKAIDELHGVGAGHSDVFAVIDILDPAAALSQDKEASS